MHPNGPKQITSLNFEGSTFLPHVAGGWFTSSLGRFELPDAAELVSNVVLHLNRRNDITSLNLGRNEEIRRSMWPQSRM